MDPTYDSKYRAVDVKKSTISSTIKERNNIAIALDGLTDYPKRMFSAVGPVLSRIIKLERNLMKKNGKAGMWCQRGWRDPVLCNVGKRAKEKICFLLKNLCLYVINKK